MYSDDVSLRFSHRTNLYYLIIYRLRQWQNGPLHKDLQPEIVRPEAQADGVRLLSLGNPTMS